METYTLENPPIRQNSKIAIIGKNKSTFFMQFDAVSMDQEKNIIHSDIKKIMNTTLQNKQAISKDSAKFE